MSLYFLQLIARSHKFVNDAIVGFGDTDESHDVENYPERLMHVEVQYVQNSVCNRAYEGLIDDSMLCASDEGEVRKLTCVSSAYIAWQLNVIYMIFTFRTHAKVSEVNLGLWFIMISFHHDI